MYWRKQFATCVDHYRKSHDGSGRVITRSPARSADS
jgi:hypothetical protein